MVIYNWLVILIFALKDIFVIVSYGENINICYGFSPFTVGYNLVADTSEYLRLTAITLAIILLVVALVTLSWLLFIL